MGGYKITDADYWILDSGLYLIKLKGLNILTISSIQYPESTKPYPVFF
jgi:hypothetical protein